MSTISRIPRSGRGVVLASLVLAFLAWGCSSTSPAPVPEPEAPSEPVAETDDRAEAVTEGQARLALDPVYFDTDRATLGADARTALAAWAEAIEAHPEWGVVTIEGHCDERGTDAYNRALGRRRAAAVERFLLERGVPSARLATRSFGSAKPVAAGHDESAWRYNRRSELQHEVLASSR